MGASEHGINPDMHTKRLAFRCLGAAQRAAASSGVSMLETWQMLTPEQAEEVLREDDIVVTNKRDKTVQLQKLKEMKDLVDKLLGTQAQKALKAESMQILQAKQKKMLVLAKQIEDAQKELA